MGSAGVRLFGETTRMARPHLSRLSVGTRRTGSVFRVVCLCFSSRSDGSRVPAPPMDSNALDSESIALNLKSTDQSPGPGSCLSVNITTAAIGSLALAPEGTFELHHASVLAQAKRSKSRPRSPQAGAAAVRVAAALPGRARVASASSPRLRWLPSPADIMMILPGMPVTLSLSPARVPASPGKPDKIGLPPILVQVAAASKPYESEAPPAGLLLSRLKPSAVGNQFPSLLPRPGLGVLTKSMAGRVTAQAPRTVI